MSLKDDLARVEATVGQFSRYNCEFSGKRVDGEEVNLKLKPAYQFLISLGVDEKTITSPLPRFPTSPSLGVQDPVAPIVVNRVEIMSRARAARLRNSAKIYLNPAIISKATYETALKATLSTQTQERSSDGIHYQNLAVGVCHVQEVDLLVDHKMIGEQAVATEKAAPIADDAMPLLLLSTPALNFSYGYAGTLTSEQQKDFISGMFKNLFHAAKQEGRTHIAMPAAGLGVFGGHPNDYFSAMMTVAKEYPELNIIYHPAQFGKQFDTAYAEYGSPSNVARATKDVMFIADALCKAGTPCAFHNPSDADVVLGSYGPGEYWAEGRGTGYVGEEHVGAMTTAPWGGRGLNPEAYSRIFITPDWRRKLMADLKAYATSDMQHFWISPRSREINSEINRKLATTLLEILDKAKSKDEFSFKLTPAFVNALRREISCSYQTNPDYVERDINSNTLNAILQFGRQQFPFDRMSQKKEQISVALTAYLARVDKRDPANGFVFFAASRAESRKANILFAVELLNKLEQVGTDEEIAAMFTKAHVATARKNRGIHSGELNAALDLARELFPQEEAQTPAPRF